MAKQFKTKMKTKTILAMLALAMTGCGTYRHQRPVTISTVGTNQVVAFETTSISLFLQKLSAAKINTKIKDGDYSRGVIVGGVGTVGDAEMVQAISEGVANGIKKSQTGGVGVPKDHGSLNAVSPSN